MFAYAGDLPQVSRARQLLAQHHHARLRERRPGDRRVRHRSAASSSATTTSTRCCGRRSSPPRTPSSTGTSASTSGASSSPRSTDIDRAPPRAGRQHAHAAAGAQPQGTVRPHQREIVRAEDPRGHPRDPDREALHQERDLHDLLQPDVPRPRRLRRRGRVAALLPEVEQAADARGSGADRRHLPDARAPEPVRRHEARDRAAATSCCSAWPTSATSRRREADAAKQQADRHARPAEPAARHRAVLRRGGAQASRAAVRRQGALRERPRRCTTTLDAGLQDLANKALEHGLRAYDKRHGWRQADAQRRRREAHDRGLQDRSLDAADRRRRHRARGRRHRAEDRRRRACASARSTPISTRDGYAWTRRDVGRPISSSRGDLVDVAITKLDAATGDRDGDARADAAGRRRAARDRQPHRPDQGDGRRLELRPQQVQPRGAGLPPARIDLQADRLHRGDRSRLHADVDHRRRAGQLRRRRRPAALQPAQLRPQVPGADHAALRARGVAQHPGDQDDGHARAEERARLREAVRLRGGLPALPADRARRRRRDAARDHERLHRRSRTRACG